MDNLAVEETEIEEDIDFTKMDETNVNERIEKVRKDDRFSVRKRAFETGGKG